MPSRDETNGAGCPLRSQLGTDAVVGFDALVGGLPPALRAAFEAERAARQAEIQEYVAEHGYHS